jgi:CheY-like chemotaxis protein
MSLRVFVVDHGRLAADGVAGLLRFMGHQVHAASCAEAALEEALGFRPDLALIDWTIPAAAEVCRGLALSGTCIIAVGSHADVCRAGEAGEECVAGFLAAPCDRSKLSKVLATVQDDVFARRDEAKLGPGGLDVGRELRRRHWMALAETTVFRLYGGIRDGQELFGDRAASLYTKLRSDPLHRTFLACRVRRVSTTERLVEFVERHQYFVESVTRSADQTLVIARSLGAYD